MNCVEIYLTLYYNTYKYLIRGLIMGFFIGCIIVFVVCMGLVKLIDGGQERTAEKNEENFLADVKKVCIEDGIEYQEPKSIKITLPDNFGYKYDHINEVSFVSSEGCIDPALYWISQNQLCFVGRNKSFKVNLDRIEMYTLDGSIQYISKVNNTGKKVSLSGAVVGGVLAGPAGMIVGATKDRNDITTDVEEKDNRKVYIYYRDKNDEIKMFNVQKTFFCEYFNFDEFIKKELPTKSDTYLSSHKNNGEEEIDKETVKDKLVKLKILYEDGLIDEDEYKNTKKELLSKLK